MVYAGLFGEKSWCIFTTETWQPWFRVTRLVFFVPDLRHLCFLKVFGTKKCGCVLVYLFGKMWCFFDMLTRPAWMNDAVGENVVESDWLVHSSHLKRKSNLSEESRDEIFCVPLDDLITPCIWMFPPPDYDSEIYANGDPLSVGSSSNELMGGVGHLGGHHHHHRPAHPRSPPEDRANHRYASLVNASRHSHVRTTKRSLLRPALVRHIFLYCRTKVRSWAPALTPRTGPTADPLRRRPPAGAGETPGTPGAEQGPGAVIWFCLREAGNTPEPEPWPERC